MPDTVRREQGDIEILHIRQHFELITRGFGMLGCLTDPWPSIQSVSESRAAASAIPPDHVVIVVANPPFLEPYRGPLQLPPEPFAVTTERTWLRLQSVTAGLKEWQRNVQVWGLDTRCYSVPLWAIKDAG